MPLSLVPQIAVTSEPEYVVGTATIGTPAVRATALAAPMVEPPPMQSTASAMTSTAIARTAAAVATGTCSTTSVNVAATRGWNGATSSRTRSASRVDAISSTRVASSRATSSASRVRAAPGPNTIRAGSASYVKACTSSQWGVGSHSSNTDSEAQPYSQPWI